MRYADIIKGGYVYFISDNLGHIKIGIAKDPSERKKDLQTANPMKLQIIFLMHVNDYNHARILEKELHEKFKKDRLQGEWFKEDAIIEFLQQPIINTEYFTFRGL